MSRRGADAKRVILGALALTVGALTVYALVLYLMVMTGGRSHIPGRVDALWTMFSLCIGLACAHQAVGLGMLPGDSQRRRGALALAFTAVGFSAALVYIWAPRSSPSYIWISDTAERVLLLAFLYAVATIIIGRVRAIAARNPAVAVPGTIATSSMRLALIIAMILFFTPNMRLLGSATLGPAALGIFLIGGIGDAVIMLLLDKIHIAQFEHIVESGLPAGARINLECPRCGHQQRMALGGDRCARCDLSIVVRVEKPACANCGYSLEGLRVDRCPECGAGVANTQSVRPVSMKI